MPAQGRALAITGVDGFVGRQLAALAHADGWRVIGLARASEPAAVVAGFLDDYVAGDLRHTWPDGLMPDAIVHLAGLAAVGPSFSRPQEYIDANSAMVSTMCESLLRHRVAGSVRVVGVSTGAVYGASASADGEPVDERAPTAPTSPYVVSKLLVESQLSYYASRGIDTVVARPFNHIGPGQSSGFLLPDMYATINSMGPHDRLKVGNLSTVRDYTDVRDVARAYLLLAGADGHDHAIYNVASGSGRTGSELLSTMVRVAGLVEPATEVDPTRLRANDPPRIVGSATRIRTEFGWRPLYSVEDSVGAMIAYLRAEGRG